MFRFIRKNNQAIAQLNFTTLDILILSQNTPKSRYSRISAFIDGNNLYLGSKSQGVKLDYRKLRLYLKNKFNVDKAYLFIGFDQDHNDMYIRLQEQGYIMVYKQTVKDVENGHKTMKGNVDAELVLYASAIQYDNYDKAIVISSYGDFSCLYRYLDDNNKLDRIITPTARYSSLLKPFKDKILPLANISNNISRNK